MCGGGGWLADGLVMVGRACGGVRGDVCDGIRGKCGGVLETWCDAIACRVSVRRLAERAPTL